jgi:hypothetical protein
MGQRELTVGSIARDDARQAVVDVLPIQQLWTSHLMRPGLHNAQYTEIALHSQTLPLIRHAHPTRCLDPDKYLPSTWFTIISLASNRLNCDTTLSYTPVSDVNST